MVNMVKLKKGETTKFTEFFSLGFENFGRSWAIYGWTLVKLLLIFLLYFVGVFVIAFLPILAVITKKYSNCIRCISNCCNRYSSAIHILNSKSYVICTCTNGCSI